MTSVCSYFDFWFVINCHVIFSLKSTWGAGSTAVYIHTFSGALMFFWSGKLTQPRHSPRSCAGYAADVHTAVLGLDNWNWLIYFLEWFFEVLLSHLCCFCFVKWMKRSAEINISKMFVVKQMTRCCKENVPFESSCWCLSFQTFIDQKKKTVP